MIDTEASRSYAKSKIKSLFSKRFDLLKPYQSLPGYSKIIQMHLLEVERTVEGKIKKFQAADTDQKIAENDIKSYLETYVLNFKGTRLGDELEKAKGAQSVTVDRLMRNLRINPTKLEEVLSLLNKEDQTDLVTVDEYKAAWKGLRTLQRETRDENPKEDVSTQTPDSQSRVKPTDIMWIRSLCSLMLTASSKAVYNEPDLRKFIKVHPKTLRASGNLLQTQALMKNTQVEESESDEMKTINAQCTLPLSFSLGGFYKIEETERIITLSVDVSMSYSGAKRKIYDITLELNSSDVPVQVPPLRLKEQTNLLDAADAFVDDMLIPSLKDLKEQASFRGLGVTKLISQGFGNIKKKLSK